MEPTVKESAKNCISLSAPFNESTHDKLEIECREYLHWGIGNNLYEKNLIIVCIIRSVEGKNHKQIARALYKKNCSFIDFNESRNQCDYNNTNNIPLLEEKTK